MEYSRGLGLILLLWSMEAAGAGAADDAGVPSEQEAGAKAEEQEEEEEEGECPFCLFMKAGPCGKEFGDWEQCVEEAEKGTDEVVVRCRSITQSLMKCMEGFTDYYGVVLQAGEKLGQQEGNVVERAEAQGGSNSSSNSTDKDQKAESNEKDENTEKKNGEEQKADSTEKDPKAGLQVQIQVEDRKELAA